MIRVITFFKWDLAVWRLVWVICVCLALVSCQDAKQSIYEPAFSDVAPGSDNVYTIGVHPLHNPQRLFKIFNPLVQYLSDNISGVTFELEASRNYAAFDKKLESREFEFSLPNPFQTILAIDKGYEVFAKMADDENFRGIILIRKDSNINEISDLKGKAVSYPAPTALAATMMPQLYIQEHGVDVMTELDNRYVGSQESSIMNVFIGNTSAGATWPPPWLALIKERPELSEQLEVKWQTAPLVNNSLVARDDVPKDVVEQVKKLLLSLHKSAEGRRVLQPIELSKFEEANDQTYDIINEFIEIFSQKVRPT